ncbi:MAG: IS3 family transposase [Rikenellaceae bacterium]
MEKFRYKYSVVKMAFCLGVSIRSYYDYRKGTYRKRLEQRAINEETISNCFYRFDKVYGAGRISSELSSTDRPLSKTTVSKYMSRLGLKSRLRGKYRVCTTDSNHNNPIAPNLLDRDFSALAPAMKWVSDITYIRRIGGFDYYTTVIDLFDRKVIGWSFSSDMTDKNTTIAALRMAQRHRSIHPDGLIFHSDRGVQYTSKAFVKLLKNKNITQSMSGKGNCWDNAVAESFFKTLKSEIIYGFNLLSSEKLRDRIFTWVECWYNKVRRHSALGNMSIDEFWVKYSLENGVTIHKIHQNKNNLKFPNLLCG